MSIEDKIRQSAADKVRVVITSRKRCEKGFTIKASDGTSCGFPSRQVALSFLLAIVRTAPVRTFELRPATRRAR